MNRGFLLGLGEGADAGIPLVYEGEASTLIDAEVGKGKSRCSAMVNILSHDGSAIIGDFAGELTKATALFVSEVKGHKVRVFDPLHIVPDELLPQELEQPSNEVDVIRGNGRMRPVRAGFNPIDYIRASKNPLTAAYRVAEALIPPGSLSEPHWAGAAQDRFVAVMLFVAFDPAIDQMDELMEKIAKAEAEANEEEGENEDAEEEV